MAYSLNLNLHNIIGGFFLLFLSCHADIKIGNKIFTKIQLEEIEKFLNSSQIQSTYQLKFNKPEEYIFDLEILKLIAKRAKLQMGQDHENYMNYIMNTLPKHPESKNLALYLTLSAQIQSHANYNKMNANHKIIQRIRNNLIRGFVIWKIANKDKSKAEKIKNELETSHTNEYKSIALSSDHFVEYKSAVMSFQLSENALKVIKRTIKGNFSDIIFENGEYTFFYLINTTTIDESDYIDATKQKYKEDFLQNQMRSHRKFVSMELIE
ncbi:hypothetical protein FZC35_01215 [Candidatus Cytomitobacter indipagum]|uniref:PpiC domain-containing protein n=1 Tax=Candidatus Cytomitobacter indipagum TaxID=2601575 RepID=A0A5C0UDD7_9PROT|nr:hypothetical protein [Candidatus Cytomitobacter indipagum]QEK37998.1 hypothetical protein FZC35_01215 [Candidatus Cytomitobacter indipagum]